MSRSNRDLLVLTKSTIHTQRELDEEVKKLHQLLFIAERVENLGRVNELIDMDAYKIITKPAKVQALLGKKLKPFQFLNNKN